MIIHDTLTCQPACRGGAGRRLFLQSIYLQSIYLQSICLSSYLIITHSTVQALEKILIAGCSITARYKAPEVLRSEVYILVHRNDEG